MIGFGGYARFYGLVRPFADRPDITMGVIFYRVPDRNPSAPPSVFPDRFYDATEGWEYDGVGTVVGSLVPYLGPIPAGEFGPVEGTRHEWIHGVSYADYASGAARSALPCIPFREVLAACSCARASLTRDTSVTVLLDACACSSADLVPAVDVVYELDACACSSADLVPAVEALYELDACACSFMAEPLFGCLCSAADFVEV